MTTDSNQLSFKTSSGLSELTSREHTTERDGVSTMRPIFVPFNSDPDIETESDVLDAYPGACEVVEVDGGWMIFESARDFFTWSNQQ